MERHMMFQMFGLFYLWCLCHIFRLSMSHHILMHPHNTMTKSSKLQIQIPPNKGLNDHGSPSPTPFPGPESAPIHPFSRSTAKLELLPPSTAGLSGIDIEEEAQLYDELRRTARLELPPVNNPNIVLHSLGCSIGS